jgi:alpha-glucosidase (family GH31 glycosyl hydrolase)
LHRKSPPIAQASPHPGRLNTGVERQLELARDEVSVGVALDPAALTVRRGGRTLISELSLWSADGSIHDRFVQITEGVLPEERLEPARRVTRLEPLEVEPARLVCSGELAGRECTVNVAVTRERVTLRFDAGQAPLRVGASWEAARGEHMTGLGARHGLDFDQAGRHVHLGADRRYTGPDCPAEMLELGGIPQGDCAPAPWLLSSRGYAVWIETYGLGTELDLGSDAGAAIRPSTRAAAGPLRLHLLTDPTPAARLRHYLSLTGLPALLPEWAYGHWRSRDFYEHQDDVVADFEGYREHGLPLDAIVLDSPWETQYNTWRFNPHQFPDARGLIRRFRSAGVRTVVWTAPWVNLDSSDGQRPPDPESERLHREPAPNYEPAAAAGHFVTSETGEPFVARWWMGTGSPVDFTSPSAEQWWRAMARSALELGVEGIKADDGDAYYLPPEVRFADGRTAAEAGWRWGGLYRESMQRALDESAPGRGVLFGRSGWSGQQRLGMLWGGDQASDFWSLRALVTATLTAAASGFSNWSHDVGGYLGQRLIERCPKELLLRWVQFGCFTPLMQSHGRFAQEPWGYDRETLECYRRFLVLHERLVPYVRAAAATAARAGLPIIRPLCLIDPGDQRGWTIADAYGYGPALWVAPVLDDGARERSVPLPRGEWIDFWTGQRVSGGTEITAPAPLDRIPVWVRSGSLIVTYPEAEIAAGLGDEDPARPLEVTLWGPPSRAGTGVRLADGTQLRWRHGRLTVTPERDVRFTER